MSNPFKDLDKIKSYKPKTDITLTDGVTVINGKEIKCKNITIGERISGNMEENNVMVEETIEKELKEAIHECKCKKDKFNPCEQLDGGTVKFYSSKDTTELYRALLEFHKTFTSVVKSSENPFHGSKYSDLSTILDTVKPLLNEQGLLLMQFPINGVTEHSVCIKTRLVHVESGEFIETDSISLRPPKIEAQGYGSVETYMRRYSLNSLLMISFSEDDTDGADVMAEDEPPKSIRETSAGRASTRSARRGI